MNKQKQKNQIPWMYDGEIVTPDTVPEWAVGMVYRIAKLQYPITGYVRGRPVLSEEMKERPKVYIGKKLLNSTRRKKIGVRAQKKQEIEIGDKRKVKKVAQVVKDSGWMNYNSSCKPLQEEMKLYPERFHKEIIQWCHSKKHMTYLEMKMQFKHNVLEVDSFNDNIGGKYFRKDIIKPIEQ